MGHYTAIARGEDGKWYDYDDDDVHEIADDEIVSSRAYLLVYQRRS